jgi:hypothetical protein
VPERLTVPGSSRNGRTWQGIPFFGLGIQRASEKDLVPGRTTSRVRRPCRNALRRTAAFPSGVFGPVERRALAWLAAFRRSLVTVPPADLVGHTSKHAIMINGYSNNYFHHALSRSRFAMLLSQILPYTRVVVKTAMLFMRPSDI